MQAENLPEGQSPPPTPKKAGKRPDFRVVQAGTDAAGAKKYEDVGAMWKNVSKAGSDFYTMKIGKLKLLVFPNTMQ